MALPSISTPKVKTVNKDLEAWIRLPAIRDSNILSELSFQQLFLDYTTRKVLYLGHTGKSMPKLLSTMRYCIIWKLCCFCFLRNRWGCLYCCGFAEPCELFSMLSDYSGHFLRLVRHPSAPMAQKWRNFVEKMACGCSGAADSTLRMHKTSGILFRI